MASFELRKAKTETARRLIEALEEQERDNIKRIEEYESMNKLTMKDLCGTTQEVKNHRNKHDWNAFI